MRRWALVALWAIGVLAIIGTLLGSLLCAILALVVLIVALVMCAIAWDLAERLDIESRTSEVYLGGYDGPQRRRGSGP